ncbi:hypothetical protein BC827DRAFT_1265948 [Russula dissimulans]|nr:hypothetical protein BC827DRAFT_1265948 [Russula dissimulans]
MSDLMINGRNNLDAHHHASRLRRFHKLAQDTLSPKVPTLRESVHMVDIMPTIPSLTVVSHRISAKAPQQYEPVPAQSQKSANSVVGPASPGLAGIGIGAIGGPSPPSDTRATPDTVYPYRAKALCTTDTASLDDPNMISSSKGEILEIIDKNGKRWQAGKEDGTIGIAPSNYLQTEG